MRLFVAIRFSPQIRNLLLETMERLRVQTRQARLTRPENLHLTLAFLGETDRTADIRAAMSEAAAAQRPFSMALSGFGCFRDLYWVGLEPCPPLSLLAENLQRRLRALGFDIPQRHFRPHITLARQVRTDRPVELEIPRSEMVVEQIVLMKSERLKGRLTYSGLFECPLG